MDRVGIKEIKQPGMNPWKKIIKRMVYELGGKFYISGRHSYEVKEINGKDFTEVKEVIGVWFIK